MRPLHDARRSEGGGGVAAVGAAPTQGFGSTSGLCCDDDQRRARRGARRIAAKEGRGMKGIAQGAGLLMLLLAACDGGADKDALADAEADGAINGRIACALEGAKPFDRNCTIDEMHGGDGMILIVWRADSGYRRLQVTTDGRGLVARSEEHTSELQTLMRISYAG